MKTILLTGGSGLLSLNWARVAGENSLVYLALHNKKVAPFESRNLTLDLGSEKLVRSALDQILPDLVIHTAGMTNIEACEANPDIARRTNVDFSRNVARACAGAGVKLVYISTDHLFDGTRRMLDERAKVAPLNTYARTKAAAEQEVLTHCSSALVIRTNFFGWGPSYRRSFSDTIVDAVTASRAITLFDDVFFTPIVIDRLIDATHLLVKEGAVGIFNVVGDERISKYDFGIKLVARLNMNSRLILAGKFGDVVGLVRRPLDMSLSNSKVVSVLGEGLGRASEQIDQLALQQSTPRVQELIRL